jgi:hypothetical protein
MSNRLVSLLQGKPAKLAVASTITIPVAETDRSEEIAAPVSTEPTKPPQPGHCPQCNANFWQSVSGIQRCAACGYQTEATGAHISVSFAQLESGEYKRFSHSASRRPPRGFPESFARITYGGPKR